MARKEKESVSVSDVATKQTSPTVAKARDPHMVNYELEIVDDLPPSRRGGGSGGHSPLRDQLAKVVGDAKFHNKWVRIGRYGKSTAATAAKNVLQQRHGRHEGVEGYTFQTRPVAEGAAETGVFVKYNPKAVVDGAAKEHEVAEAERKAKLAKAKAAAAK